MADSFREYSKQAFTQFLTEARKDVRGTLIALIGALAVLILQFTYNLVPAKELRTRLLISAIPLMAVLLGYILYHGLRAPWLLHNNLKGRVETSDLSRVALEHALAVERENLSDSPQLILQCPGAQGKQEFYIRNIGSPARNIRLAPVESATAVLTSKVVGFLQEGAHLFTFVCTPKEDADKPSSLSSERSFKAFEKFVEDAQMRFFPEGMNSSDPGEVFNSTFEYVLHTAIHVKVQVLYEDLLGKQFVSPCEIVWMVLGNYVQEILPGPLSRLPTLP